MCMHLDLLPPDVGALTRKVDLGSSLSITCQAQIPPPLRPTVIRWLSSKGTSVSTNSILNFTNFREEDAGRYECRVMTQNGETVSSSVNITINIVTRKL